MYLERWRGGRWSLTELRAGKGRVERSCCCTGRLGLEATAVRGSTDEEL